MHTRIHVIVWQENTGLQAKQKKDKRNNRKLLTNRKQCYIIQSSTRDKRNKINKKTQLKKEKNGGSKNEKVVKCRIKQRGK